MGAVALLARRQVRAHGARGALTAAGVALGVALVVAIRVINASTLAGFTEAIEDLAGTAALQVRGPGPFSETIADRLRALPEVDHAVPIVTATFFAVDPPAAGEALAVFAADVTDGHAIKTLHLVKAADRVVDDPLSFLVDPTSIILTDTFAARLGIGRNAQLRLRTPAGIRSFTVRGILPPGGVGRAYGGNLLLMDVVGAQVVLGRDRMVDEVDVTLRPGVAVDDATRAIDAALASTPGLEAVPPARRGEQIERYLRSYRTLLSGISGLALLAAIFVAGSAVGTSVAARRREIGLLRCVGAVHGHVRRLVLGEAITLGAVGASVGVPLGMALGRLLLRSVSQSAELVFSMKMLTAGLAVSPATLGLGVASGLTAALIAGWLPARDALRVGPLAAVRRGDPPPAERRWPAPGTLALALAATVAGLAGEIWLDSPWSGNVAAVAADFALVILFMRRAEVVTALLVPVRPRLGIAGQLAVDRLIRIPDQLALAAGVLALGLGLMLMSGTLARSFEQSVLDFIRHQVRADLVVASAATTGWIEAPIEESLTDRLLAVPGVGRVERLRLAEQEYEGSRISVDSLDDGAFAPERASDFTFAAGDPATALAAVRTGSAALVSRNFARHFHVRVGDTPTIRTPAGPFTPRVVGVVVDYVSPRGSIVLSRATYQRWWNDHAVNRFHVTVAPGADAEVVRRAIAGGVGAVEGLKVLTQRELYAYHQDAVGRAFRFTRALEVLPLIVAGLGLAEALIAVSLDRRREFALLRAAGATRGQIARSVVGEAAGVGFLGLAGGLVMGAALAVLWVRINFAYQLGWDVDLHVSIASLPAAAVAAFLVSIPAGVLPARWIARLPVVEALREG